MRAVIQRAKRASVMIAGEVSGQIEAGLVVLLAVGQGDARQDLELVGRKILNLRIFADAEGRMNCSVKDVGGEILLISQFTLYGDCRRGNRPSYSRAAAPEPALQLYDDMLAYLQESGLRVASGQFQADMEVALVNDGPVTLIVDSRTNRAGATEAASPVV